MQNKISKSILVAGMISIFSMISCSKKIDDAYLNPSAPVIVPIETILPGVIGGLTAFNSAAGTNYGVQIDDILLGRYIQYWGTTTNGELYGQMGFPGSPASASDNTGGIWATVYYGHGENINKIIDWGTEQQKWDFVGVAQAIRAWGWLELVNQYGEAILKEAFNPLLSQFKYDEQPLFYDSCRAICHRALSNLNRTDGNVNPANLAQSDAYFNQGDINKWKKFVYGILARSYIDLSNKSDFLTKGWADSAIKYAALSCTTNADNQMATFSVVNTSNGYNSYFGPTRSNIGAIRQSKYVADLMSGLNPGAFTGVNDPRCWYMLSENSQGTFKGFTPWLGATEHLNGSAALPTYPKNFWRHATATQTIGTNDSARYVYSNQGPWPMMTASEMQFSLAEAAFRKGDKTTARAAYINGISLNFDMMINTYSAKVPASKVITPAIRDAYLANPAIVPATAAGLTMTHIMLQKYIALYGWGVHQTWVDMRKFHYTAIYPGETQKVYADFNPPPVIGNFLMPTNNGKLVYRCRPRYNSEYLYNIPELTRLGALALDYNTVECWFSLP